MPNSWRDETHLLSRFSLLIVCLLGWIVVALSFTAESVMAHHRPDCDPNDAVMINARRDAFPSPPDGNIIIDPLDPNSDWKFVASKIGSSALEADGSHSAADVNCDGLIDSSDTNAVQLGVPLPPTPTPTITPTPQAVPSRGRIAPVPPPTAGSEQAPKLCELQYVVQNLISTALGAGGLLLFIMVIWGGFKWLTAGANDKAVAEARGTITWAVFGLIIMLASFFLLQFISNFTKVTVTNFAAPWIGTAGVNPCQ